MNCESKEGNENVPSYVQMLEKELNDCILREKNYSLWMGSIIRKLPDQRGYNRLPLALREEIEDIISAID